MFLFEHVPSVFDEFRRGLRLVPVASGCEYLTGIRAFDQVSVRMRLAGVTRTEIGLIYDCVRVEDGADELVARAWQRHACVRSSGGAIVAAQVPEPLRLALEGYPLDMPRRGCPAGLRVAGRV